MTMRPTRRGFLTALGLGALLRPAPPVDSSALDPQILNAGTRTVHDKVMELVVSPWTTIRRGDLLTTDDGGRVRPVGKRTIVALGRALKDSPPSTHPTTVPVAVRLCSGGNCSLPVHALPQP